MGNKSSSVEREPTRSTSHDNRQHQEVVSSSTTGSSALPPMDPPPKPPAVLGFGHEGHKRLLSDHLAGSLHRHIPALLGASEQANGGAGGWTPGSGTPPPFLRSGPPGSETPQSPQTDGSPRLEDAWYLLYSSELHGKSYNRMIQLTCNRGATLVVIAEGGHSGRVFGGYNSEPWQTVEAREKAARSASAAQSRAARTGQAGSAKELGRRPENQAPQFFGDQYCFVFSNTNADGTPVDTAASPDFGAVVYRGKTSINSNFMYLFDTHPDDDRVGMGMGGQPQRHGWFLDRWLEQGHCRGAKCTTFGNPALSSQENFPIAAVEVYAVDPRIVGQLRAQTVTPAGKPAAGPGVLQRGTESNCDKMLLQLHTGHQFRSEQFMAQEEEAADFRECDGSLY